MWNKQKKQKKSSIPIEWKETLKLCGLMPKSIPSGNIIKINNKIKKLGNITYKDFYCHLLNTDPHTPAALQKWYIHYPIFKEASVNTLDLYICLTQLKQALKIEDNICRKHNNKDNFFKFHFIYEKQY